MFYFHSLFALRAQPSCTFEENRVPKGGMENEILFL